MKVAEKSFTADGVEFPAGSFIIAPPADMAAVRAAVEEFGLTAAALSARADGGDARRRRAARRDLLAVERHAGARLVPLTFDKFGIPFDLIYKERVKKGNLKADYDVILMPTQNVNRAAVLAPPAARPRAVREDRQVQVPRDVRRVAGHDRRLRPGGRRRVRSSSSTAAAR